MPASSDSSDDNDSLDSLSIAKSSFRVSVCLKRYFKDIRALCFLLITRKRTVRWLERRIQKLFDLRGAFHLQTRGHLLPSSERLGLLNPDDLVEVIPLEIESQNYPQNEGLHNSSNIVNSDEQDIPDSGAKSRISPFSECQKNIHEKANKCQKNLEIEESNFCNQNGHQDMLHSNFPKKIKPNDNELQKLKQNALAYLESKYYGVVANETLSLQDIVIPRKRKRVRRKRQRVVSQELQEEATEAAHELPNNTTTEVESEDYHNLNDHKSDTNISDESSMTTSTIVSHNEEACVRKPRIVRSLINAS